MTCFWRFAGPPLHGLRGTRPPRIKANVEQRESMNVAVSGLTSLVVAASDGPAG